MNRRDRDANCGSVTWTGSQSIVGVSFVMILLIIAPPRISYGQIYCGYADASAVFQESDAWCSFACLEYITAELGQYRLQCDFAHDFCSLYPNGSLVDPNDCGHCCGLGDCTGFYPTVGQVASGMNILGFGGPDGDVNWTSAISQSDLYDYICGESVLLLVYVPSPGRIDRRLGRVRLVLSV